MAFDHFLFIFTVGLECNASVDVLDILQDVIDDYEDDFDETLSFESLYEEDCSSICYHVYEYQQMQMVETKERIDKDAERYHEGNANKTDDQDHIVMMRICNAEIKDFVRADDNSSRSNASSIIVQNEMKSEKAQAALQAFKDYDYRVECEGRKRGSVDPIRVCFQKKRMQRILAVSKRRKLSCHTSELLTTRYQHMHTAAESQYHVLPQYDDNTSAMLATYDKPQHISTSTLLEDDMPYIEYSMVIEPESLVVFEEK